MDPQSRLYLLTFAGLAQATALLALLALRRAARPGAPTLAALLLALTLRSLAALSGPLAAGPALETLAVKLGYVGFALAGPLWLAFALQATGRSHRLTARALALLAAPAALAAGLALTNELHRLIWAAPGPAAGPPAELGAAGIVYSVLTSAYLLGAAIVFAVTFTRAAPTYRRRLGLLAAGALVPLAGNALTLAGLPAASQFDLSLISLPLAAVLFALALLPSNRLELAPVAARVVMDNLRDAVVVLDAAGRVADLNTAAQRLFGGQDELLGRPAAEALAVEPVDVWGQPAEAQAAPAEVLAGTPESQGEYQLTLSPLRDERGRLLGRVALLHDISHESAVLKMRDDLTHMLIHDLRNPFSAIHSALQLIDTLFREEQSRAQGDGHAGALPRAAAVQGAIDIALHSSERAHAMLDSLLDLNRLESGEVPVTPAVLEAGLAAHEVVQALQAAAAERGLRLTAEISANLPPGQADPDLLDRVLRNLIDNALKFTPSGGNVTVAVRAADGRLLLSVSDDGPGIAPQVRPRLFQKFARGSGPAHGSGLGLAFCKLAVEAMGGRLWADSEPGQGAAFHFTLPQAHTPPGGGPPSDEP